MKVRELDQYLKIDLEGALARFMGREDMYAKFLYKLQQDETFQKLTEAVESQTLSDIERYAHTLKGVLGNLGLEEGYQTSSELVQVVREDHTEKIEPLYLVLKEQMQTYLNVIGMLEQPGQ